MNIWKIEYKIIRISEDPMKSRVLHEKETGLKPADYNPVTIFRALGDELRLAALLLIRDQEKLCVCELTEAFGVAQPKVSRHLATLRDAGLVETERRGQWVYYYLTVSYTHLTLPTI